MKDKISFSYHFLSIHSRVGCYFGFPSSHGMGWKICLNALKMLLNYLC